METSDRADRVAMLRDARKQRYFLSHPHDTIAPQPKSHVIYGPDNYYGAVGVIDLHADMALNTSIPEASVVHVQREDLVVPSAEPVLVASPIASDSHSSTPAFPPANDTAPTLPSKATLDKAADLIVYDAQGQAVPFKELYQAEPGQRRRVMVIFIRHFFCGVSGMVLLDLHALTRYITIRTARNFFALSCHKFPRRRFLPTPR